MDKSFVLLFYTKKTTFKTDCFYIKDVRTNLKIVLNDG
jgi:hypothetical protein